jgi:hypothetical protein
VSEAEVWIDSPRVWRAHHRLARRLVWGAAAAAVLPLLLAGLVDRLWGVRLYDAVSYGFLLMSVLGIAALVAPRIRVGAAAAVGVVGRHLVIVRGRKRERIPLADLAQGWASPVRGAVDLILRGGDTIHAVVPQGDDAERLLVAAGLDVSKRTMRLELGETLFLDLLTILLGPILLVWITPLIAHLARLPWEMNVPIFIGLFALLLKLVRATFGPAQVVVGADGIIVEHGFRTRFVSHDRLAALAMKHDALDLTLTDGSRVRAHARHLTGEQRAELRARIEAALAIFRRDDVAAGSLARLDRGGRALDAWRASLHAILEQHGSYRETPLTRDQLFEVLESAASPVEHRLGAALSLSAAGDANVHARIRVAAEACANPRVRIALAKVADGGIDEGAIDEAIAEDEAARAKG